MHMAVTIYVQECHQGFVMGRCLRSACVSGFTFTREEVETLGLLLANWGAAHMKPIYTAHKITLPFS